MKTPWEALELLVAACRHKTGQSYKIRALLYSLWNGKPASLIEVLNLDSNLRFALVMVINAFGRYVDGREFFYDDIKRAFANVGEFEWFCREGDAK